jgi:hypothetical protein
MAKARWIALALLVIVGGDGWAGEPCKLATKGDSPVAKACREGGFQAARKLMKDMKVKVNQGRTTRVDCKDCHDHDEDGHYDTLTKDGRERFTALLAEYDKKK